MQITTNVQNVETPCHDIPCTQHTGHATNNDHDDRLVIQAHFLLTILSFFSVSPAAESCTQGMRITDENGS